MRTFIDPATVGANKPLPYLEIYERELAALTERPVCMLELGLDRGGSLRLWREFFPHGVIAGLDAVAVTVDDPGGRLRIYRGMQEDTALLDRIARECAPDGFDFIVDDASHLGRETRISFWHLFTHHLKPGGIYVIEDWGTGYSGKWPDGRYYVPAAGPDEFAGNNAGMVGFVKELVDETGRGAITNPDYGLPPRVWSRFAKMTVYPGQVFVWKKHA